MRVARLLQLSGLFVLITTVLSVLMMLSFGSVSGNSSDLSCDNTLGDCGYIIGVNTEDSTEVDIDDDFTTDDTVGQIIEDDTMLIDVVVEENTTNVASVNTVTALDDHDHSQTEQSVAVSTPTPAPVSAPATYSYPQGQGYSYKSMNYPYSAGVGSAPAVDTTTASLLSQLGYNASTLWSSGIKVVSYNGLVPKNCALGSSLYISGMAVKPVTYQSCPDGQQVIPESYKTDGKCTVHYDASKNWGGTATGNSKAVLAHELSHCLHFIYGEYGGFDTEYDAIRGTAGFGQASMREVMADDFMICRHGVDTSWGGGSYYNSYGVTYPSAGTCAELNELFNRYFAV